MTKRSTRDMYDPEDRKFFLRNLPSDYRDQQVFIHYKGGVYEIVYDDARHTETEEVLVVYRHLWPHDDSQVWCRPLNMFHDNVRDNDQWIPRFERVNFDAL